MNASSFRYLLALENTSKCDTAVPMPFGWGRRRAKIFHKHPAPLWSEFNFVYWRKQSERELINPKNDLHFGQNNATFCLLRVSMGWSRLKQVESRVWTQIALKGGVCLLNAFYDSANFIFAHLCTYPGSLFVPETLGLVKSQKNVRK